jgi:hypothetical protein
MNYDNTRPMDNQPYDGSHHDPTVPLWQQRQTPPPPPPSRPRLRLEAFFIVGLSALSLVLIVALIVMSGILKGPSRSRTSTVSQPNGTVPPGVTPTIPVTCASLPAFAHAGAATTDSMNFADAPFPAGSFSVRSDVDTEANSFLHRLLSICSPHLTVAGLGAALNATLASAGWSATSTSANDEHADCGDLCWKRLMPSTVAGSSAQITRFIGIHNVVDRGGVVTYTMELTIAPLTSGQWTLQASNTNFSADLAPTVDLFWAGHGQIRLVNAAFAAPLALPAGGFDAIHFTDLQSITGLKNTLSTQEVKTGSAVALKGNGGHLSKLLIIQSDQAQVTFQWVTYPFGF